MPLKKKLAEDLPLAMPQADAPGPGNEPIENLPQAQGSFFSRKKWLVIGVLAAILITGLVVWRQHSQNVKQQMALKDLEAKKPADEAKQLVNDLSQLIVLPKDEEPVVATVVDLEKLKGQPFFANARLQDKVVIYAQAGKAILYRPGENKIVEVAPFSNPAASNPGSQVLGALDQPQNPAQLKLEIRNGSGKAGAANDFKAQLAGKSELNVLKVGNAQTSYPKTLLYVSGTGKNAGAVKTLQDLSSAEIITALPAGEPPTSADALLILGQNK